MGETTAVQVDQAAKTSRSIFFITFIQTVVTRHVQNRRIRMGTKTTISIAVVYFAFADWSLVGNSK